MLGGKRGEGGGGGKVRFFWVFGAEEKETTKVSGGLGSLESIAAREGHAAAQLYAVLSAFIFQNASVTKILIDLFTVYMFTGFGWYRCLNRVLR